MLTPTLLTTLELPALPTISEYEFRALRREDVPALYDLWLLIEQADDRNLVNTLADLQRDFDVGKWRHRLDQRHGGAESATSVVDFGLRKV